MLLQCLANDKSLVSRKLTGGFTLAETRLRSIQTRGITVQSKGTAKECLEECQKMNLEIRGVLLKLVLQFTFFNCPCSELFTELFREPRDSVKTGSSLDSDFSSVLSHWFNLASLIN